MNNYIKALGFLAITTFAIFTCLWTYHSFTSMPSEPECKTDSTSTNCCDTIQACDTTQIYVYETDSCCKH